MSWREEWMPGPERPVKRLVWQNPERTEPASLPRFKRKPKWVNHATAILVIISLVWVIQGIVIPWTPKADELWHFKGAPFLRHKTPEEIEYEWQTISRINNCVLAPEIRPIRPGPIEQGKFWKEEIQPIWHAALAKGPEYFMEDYYDSWGRILEVCKANFMPIISNSLVGTDEWAEPLELASKNGWRNPENAENADAISKASMDREFEYNRWYEQATAISSPDVNWLAVGLWFIFTYLKGMVISLVIFVVRIKGDACSSLRQELCLAPLRFAKMLLGWPACVFLYPYDTDTAIEIRRFRLRAEYLRDKPWNYRLSEAEEAELSQMVEQSTFGLKQVLALIASTQEESKRKALATVGLLMFFGLLCSTLARAQSSGETIRPSQVVVSCSQTQEEQLQLARDGPNQTNQSTDWPVALTAWLVELPLITVGRLVIAEIVQAAQGLAARIDHVPKRLVA